MEVCPSCNGSGQIEPTQLLPDEIERNVNLVIEAYPKMDMTLKVNPFVYSYLKKGIINQQMSWLMKYKKWIKLKQDNDFLLTEYRFYNKFNDEIRIGEDPK